MARIRTIKPEFWSSPGIERLSPWARLLYIAMWNWADDFGRGTANLKELQAFAFPFDENDCVGTPENFRRVVAEVRDAYDVAFYKVGGRRYFAIPTWSKHQRNEKRSAARHPGPDDGTPWDFMAPDQGIGGTPENPRHSAAEGSPVTGGSPEKVSRSNRGTGEQGNRGTGKERKKTSSSSCPKSAISDEPRVDVEDLCGRLHARIVDNGAKATITEQWRTEARLLLDRDGRNFDQALKLIDWAAADDFWSANILSMPKFRKQYDQLLMKARNESRQPGGANYQHPTDLAVARLLGGSNGQSALPRALPGGDPT